MMLSNLATVFKDFKNICQFSIVIVKRCRWLSMTSYSVQLSSESSVLRYSTNAQGNSTRLKISTVDPSEVQKFSILAQQWWNESGAFAALHSLNSLRLRFVIDGLVDKSARLSPTPLKACTILDVGCGGGILSEPLARLGAEVTGIDASQENIEVACSHASYDPMAAKQLQYISCPVEKVKMFNTAQYDAVILSEIVEHVDDASHFLSECCSLVKIGGSIFITTINRTPLSYVLAIVTAEKLLRIVPPNAHDWNKFVSPQVLQQILLQNSFDTKKVHGMGFNPINLKWSWINNTSCNYALHAIKV